MTILNDGNPPWSEVLAHFGIKGMRWGQRKAKTGPNGKPMPTRKQLRGMDKAARAKQKAADRKEIDKDDQSIRDARSRVGQAHANIRAAKKKYKGDKKMIGKVAARSILEKTTQKDFDTLNNANRITSRERTGLVIAAITVGALEGATKHL